MTFALTDTQTMVFDMAGKLFASENDPDQRRRRLSEDRPDRLALWPSIVRQGIIGIGALEQHGGFGSGVRDLAVVMSQVGEWLVVEPVLTSFLALRVLQAAGDRFQEDIAAIIAGERILAFAHQETSDPYVMPSVRAQCSGSGIKLTGVKPLVRHGDIADGFVVTAMLGGEIVFCRVSGDTEGVSRRSCRLMDAASAAEVTFRAAEAQKIASGREIFASVINAAMVCLCAEAVGICRAANRQTFEYLKTRRQFGVPLAAFQALQHRAADMHIAAEEMRCLTDALISAVDRAEEDIERTCRMTKAHADLCGRRIGHDAVQLHGGMGVSDELVISHYMKRLAVIRQECGTSDLHYYGAGVPRKAAVA